MQTEAHTFPMPETEAHKLDDLQHEIEETSGSRSYMETTKEFAQANRWWLTGAAVVSGIAAAILWQRRK